MENVHLTEVPAEDRDEVRRFTESHGSAHVLRVGNALGADATRALLAYRKEFGELPEYDYVWCAA